MFSAAFPSQNPYTNNHGCVFFIWENCRHCSKYYANTTTAMHLLLYTLNTQHKLNILWLTDPIITSPNTLQLFKIRTGDDAETCIIFVTVYNQTHVDITFLYLELPPKSTDCLDISSRDTCVCAWPSGAHISLYGKWGSRGTVSGGIAEPPFSGE